MLRGERSSSMYVGRDHREICRQKNFKVYPKEERQASEGLRG